MKGFTTRSVSCLGYDTVVSSVTKAALGAAFSLPIGLPTTLNHGRKHQKSSLVLSCSGKSYIRMTQIRSTKSKEESSHVKRDFSGGSRTKIRAFGVRWGCETGIRLYESHVGKHTIAHAPHL